MTLGTFPTEFGNNLCYGLTIISDNSTLTLNQLRYQDNFGPLGFNGDRYRTNFLGDNYGTDGVAGGSGGAADSVVSLNVPQAPQTAPATRKPLLPRSFELLSPGRGRL